MAVDLTASNKVLEELDELVRTGEVREANGELRCGVDLGTANIVLAVVDEDDRPIAGASYPAHVIRDGVVMDYVGSVRIVRRLRAELEQRLGRELDAAAAAIPPGVVDGSTKAVCNVVEAADFRLTNVVDEPTAAAKVMDIRDGAVVDVGGGTTGISVLKGGEVTYVADEPTGGTHMTLVLAGAMGMGFDEADAYKCDPANECDVYPIVKPTVEKMADIVKRFIADQPNPVETVYVVGGACSFEEFEGTFQKYLGIEVVKPSVPLLVTPLGIALECGR